MISLIVARSSDSYFTPLLGLPVGLRSLLAAVDAGAIAIELRGEAAAQLEVLAKDPRVKAMVTLGTVDFGERLIVRADALVAPALLVELAPGESICDHDGTPLAAKVTGVANEDPLAAFQSAVPKAWSQDRYHYALLLRDRADFRQAERTLLASLVKPSDGPVSRHINRRVSLAITKLVLPLGITPNQMTVVVALLGATGAWLATSANWPIQVLGAVFFQLHSIVDGCDGEIARLTRRFSRYGALLDSLVDDVSNTLFFVGLSVGVSRSVPATWPLWTAAVVVLCYPAMAAIQYRTSVRSSKLGDKNVFWASGRRKRSSIASILVALLRRDVFVLLILGAVVIGLSPVLVALFPLAALGALAASIAQAIKVRRLAL